MEDLAKYLTDSQWIDCRHPAIATKAAELAADSHPLLKADSFRQDGANPLAIAERCFLFVRDRIEHSLDFRRNPVTCKASEVLLHGTGYCFAKSHLLVALLRANGIPAGLCYQRLELEPHGKRYCLHGLAAVYLPEFGWYRVDPRGNKPGVDAQFSPPIERLAFPISAPGERDLPGIWEAPMPCVVKLLTENETFEDVLLRLPDVS